MKIKTVTVIGANGVLGKQIAAIFASFGNANVYMLGREIDKLNMAKEEAALSVRAMSIKNKLYPKAFDDFGECIRNSDLIFESVAEDYAIKEKIHKDINKYAKNDCIIATGTSGLSINKIAECYAENLRKNVIGLHFFNPPYNLTLCELILSKYNKDNNAFISEIKEYATNILCRDLILVKDEPGFLANRIGFQFLNEALQYAEKYKEKGGIDYIDSILGCYTGRNMAPIKTVDFIGLDIHKAIADNIYMNTSDCAKETFILPEYVNKLIKKGSLGKKAKQGLYKKDGNKNLVYDIESNTYREIRKYENHFKEKAIRYFSIAEYKKGIECIRNDNSEESKICLQFLLKYILYSIITTEQVGENNEDCDIAMATGFNWIPPYALVQCFGGKNEIIKLMQENLKGQWKEAIEKIKQVPESKYDYRKFLKAKE